MCPAPKYLSRVVLPRWPRERTGIVGAGRRRELLRVHALENGGGGRLRRSQPLFGVFGQIVVDLRTRQAEMVLDVVATASPYWCRRATARPGSRDGTGATDWSLSAVTRSAPNSAFLSLLSWLKFSPLTKSIVVVSGSPIAKFHPSLPISMRNAPRSRRNSPSRQTSMPAVDSGPR